MIDKDKLYKWQKEAFQKWTENGLQGIVEAPTGVGKTIFGLFCMQTIRRKTIIIVPTKVLMKQWKQEIMDNLEVPEDTIGFIGDGYREDKPITIAVINSVRQEDLSRFHMLICDEVHRYGSIKNIQPLSNSAIKIRLGITATLEREDNAEELLKQYLGNVVYQYKQTDAIKDDVLNKFELINVGIDMTLLEKNSYNILDLEVKKGMKYFNNNFIKLKSTLKHYMHPDFKTAKETIKAIGERRKIYSNSIPKAKETINIIEEHANDKIIIFNEYIGMAERIYEMLIEKCYKVGIYHSNTKEKDVINDFTTGKINILVAVKSLNEGLNVKNANIGIVVSSNSVKRNTIQRLGRVIRKEEGKEARFYQLYCRNTKEMQDVQKRTALLKEITEKITWK